MDAHTFIGRTASDREVALTLDERLRHTAIFGATGVGKATLLSQDIARGDGLLLLDPHGDFAEAALSLVPKPRSN